MIQAELVGDHIKIEKDDWINQIHHQKYYGKKQDESLILTPVEGFHLVKSGSIEIKEQKEPLNTSQLEEKFNQIDSRFSLKYRVYEDLRDRGLVAKPGFKFGADFRVYPRGGNPYKEGEKSQKDHTKWVVQAKHQDASVHMNQLSRAVRLASNIRARMLWAVVDGEQDVTYYEVDHVSP